MILVSVQLHAVHHLTQLAIHSHVQVAALYYLLKKLAIMSLSASDQRRHHIDTLAVVVFSYQVEYLVVGVFHHLLARHIGISHASPCEQQTQIVINLRRGADCGARILVRGLLLYGYYGTQACYLVNVRTLKVAKEVSGVSREGLNVAALPFGEYRVESQRRLAAARQSRYDSQFATRYQHVYVLEIMHTSAADLDAPVFAAELTG